LTVSGVMQMDGRIRLSLAVTDTGIGIRPEDLSGLFNSFERVDSRSNQNIEGTGLGLTIARSLCRAMGGDISVASEYGKGSVFTAVLLQGVVAQRPQGAAAERDTARKATFIAPEAEVMVVDDLPSNLLVAQGLLSPYQVRTVACQSGREAVDLARASSFDLVFMDHMMPGMDGLEAAAAIRALAGREEMPIIALTANAVSGMREMFLQNGFCDFLSKPIAVQALETILKKWIPLEKQRPIRQAASDDRPSDQPDGQPDAPVGQAVLLDGLDVERGIQNVGGRKAAYANLLSLFRQDCETLAPGLLTAADGDYSACAIAAHALKGSLRTIGAGDLAVSAMRLEHAAANADAAFLQENTRSFLDELRTLTGAFDRVLQDLAVRTEANGNDSPGTEELPEKLEALQGALRSMDVRAVNDLLAECLGLELTPEQRALVDELDMLVMAFEFEKAAASINDYIKQLFS
jgi:CheY-like chemotaxis protein